MKILSIVLFLGRCCASFGCAEREAAVVMSTSVTNDKNKACLDGYVGCLNPRCLNLLDDDETQAKTCSAACDNAYTACRAQQAP